MAKKKTRTISEAKIKTVMKLIETEFRSASAKHDALHTPHEGWALLLEEVDELWVEVKKKPKSRSVGLMAGEAVQVGAMAARFIYDFM